MRSPGATCPRSTPRPATSPTTWGRPVAPELIRAGSADYERLRKPAIARFHDACPVAIARCTTAADVVEAIVFARRLGLPLAVRSGGHCFAGRSSTSGVVIDVGPMRSVSFADGVATVGAGARLGDLYDALLEHDVTIPAGCGPDVGIAGLTLGGGLGILGRKHGLTSDQLVGAEVVLADGRAVECDEHSEEDLFWALRGAGGGNFGVVTSLVFRTIAPPEATAFHLVWPYGDAAAVVAAWQTWAPAAPDELAASLLITASDRGEQVNVFGAMLGADPDTAELLDQLVDAAGVEPASAERRHASHRDTKRYLVELGLGDERPDVHAYSKSEFFARRLPDDAIGELLAGFARGRGTGESRELDFTPWAGAYNRVPATATAFPHRNELFLLKQAAAVKPGAATGAREWLERSWEAVHPYGSGGVYPNFPDPDLEDEAQAYYGQNLERVLRAKARYDPGDVFGSSVRAP